MNWWECSVFINWILPKPPWSRLYRALLPGSSVQPGWCSPPLGKKSTSPSLSWVPNPAKIAQRRRWHKRIVSRTPYTVCDSWILLLLNVRSIVSHTLRKCEVGAISMDDVHKSCVIGVETSIEGFTGKERISGIKTYKIRNKQKWY